MTTTKDRSRLSMSLDKLSLGKYSGLFLLVGAFFVLILAIAGVTAYLTEQNNKLIAKLDLVTQQIDLANELSEDVYNIGLYGQMTMAETGDTTKINVADMPQTAVYRIADIKKRTDVLTRVIAALDADGGKIEFDEGKVVIIDGIKQAQLQPFVQGINTVWQPYEGLLKNFATETRTGVVGADTMKFMVDYSRMYGHQLRFDMRHLYDGLSFYINKNARTISLVQAMGAALAFVLFLALIFGVLGRLSKADAEITAAQKETQEIMQTVNTGLFLLDKDLNVGNQHSKALIDIIGTDRLAGETLSSVLKNRISDKDLQTAEEFIGQLYNPRVKEKLVDSLNPLHKVMMYDPEGGESRYLDFKFSRVYEGKDIARILVNVNDVSEAVKLEQRLQRERAENDRQMEMLTTILNVKPNIMSDFIVSTKNRIDKMNGILKNPGSSQFELEGKLKALYREMHSLKGESSALKLHTITKITSNAEDKLHVLQNQDKLSGNDFLPLAVQLDELLNLLNAIQELGNRLNPQAQTAQPQTTASVASVEVEQPPHTAGTQSHLAEYLAEFGRDIAARQHKDVVIDVSAMHGVAIPDSLSLITKEVCVQLLRNAIVHGIADSQTRIANGKSPQGRVAISIQDFAIDENYFIFVVEDDGQGIDYDAIRQKLIDSGHLPEKVNALDKGKLLNILFSSGFTTKKTADEDGGRGVGLDIVKERIKEYGGKINVQSEKGKFARFVVKLPIPKV